MHTESIATLKTLDDLFLRELEEMYDAEHRIVRMLSAAATAGKCWKLKKAIHLHMLETEGHVMKLDQVFRCFGAHVTGRTCKATLGLVEEGAEIALEFEGSPAINAAMVAFLHKVEHYEIAAYTSLHEWALLLRNPDAAELLEEILMEEKSAGQTWLELARSTSNEEAVGKYGWDDLSEPVEMNAAS